MRQVIEKIGDDMTDKIKSDLCASFQKTICDVLSFKMEQAIKKIKNKNLKRRLL